MSGKSLSLILLIAMTSIVAAEPIDAEVTAAKGGILLETQPPKSMPKVLMKANVTMCAAGCDATNFKAALAMTEPKGTLTVSPGVYMDCAIIEKPITLVGRADGGMRPHLKDVACDDKAALVLRVPGVTVAGFEVSGIKVGHGNGACVHSNPEVGGFTLKDMDCHDSQNGVITQLQTGEILIEDSVFRDMHSTGGLAHAIYISQATKFTLRNSVVRRTVHGHLVKTGALVSVIENNVLASLDASSARAVDAFAGNTVLLRNNIIQGGPNAENQHFIYYGGEKKRRGLGPHVFTAESNTFIIDDPVRKWHIFRPVVPSVAPYIISMTNNRVVGSCNTVPDFVVEKGTTSFRNRIAAGLIPYDGSETSLPRALPR